MARIARPSEPPICRDVFTRPEARPASSGRAPVIAAIVTGTKERPIPADVTSDGPRMSPTYVPSGETCANSAMPAAWSPMPTTSIGPAPIRVTSFPAMAEPMTIVTGIGRNATPALIGE